MKELNTLKIEKIINDFLEPFECKCELSDGFTFDDATNIITYALFYAQDGTDKDFLDAIEKHHKPQVTADLFLWSLLHEIGHHETLCQFSDKDFEEYLTFSTDAFEGKHTNYEYCTCPIEWTATEWAVEYANNNFEEISIFWNELQSALMEFYRKYKLIDA